MSLQVLVIGLGQFGLSLVRSLSGVDAEVIAVDRSKDKVRLAADFAASVSCIDATDEAALGALAPDRRDICICAIGDESRESSIICTALLRQLGAKRVLARATDPLHERILGLIGAHEIINPESTVGQRIAKRLVYEEIRSEIELADDLVISDITPAPALVGHTLATLELPKRHEVTVGAIRRGDDLLIPGGALRIEQGDRLILIARPGKVSAMLEKLT